MPATFLSGEDCRCDLNQTAYHIRKFRIEYDRARLDVSNSEGVPGNADAPADADPAPGFGAALRGLRIANVTIEEATFDVDQNVFDSTPVNLGEDDYVEIKIYPNGREGDFHYFPSVQVEKVTHEGEVGQLQPVSFNGGSDGYFYLYGEVKP